MTLRSELVAFTVWLVVTTLCAIACAAIAERKGRPAGAFFLLGLVFSVIAVAVTASLPSKARSLPSQLAELKRRHAAGTLSAEQLAAERARLLDDPSRRPSPGRTDESTSKPDSVPGD